MVERVPRDRQRVRPGVGELVARARDDGAGLQADGLEAVDHLVLAVGDRDVTLSEQFDDDPGRAVVALENELEDAVELVLLDAREVRT